MEKADHDLSEEIKKLQEYVYGDIKINICE
jgi:hypothetical protein